MSIKTSGDLTHGGIVVGNTYHKSYFGNSTGYIQQWSAGKVIDLIGRYFDSIEIKHFLPWIMRLCRVTH
ncbi:MAG: hypothetical protein L6406_18640 [Desulfobacterales bacterium]|nr:hypothetical protein [Desulfobacterales bacterium]